MQQVKSFQEVDLAAITASNEAWWKGELGRPIFHCVVHPPAPALSGNGYAPRNFLPLYPRQMPVQQILEEHLAQMRAFQYLGDGFPLMWMNFGAGVLAAMVGGEGMAAKETVWFSPGVFKDKDLEEIAIRFNPETDWAKWLADFYQTADQMFEGTPMVAGMTDLGGVLDVLASLRGTQNLLMDLLDSPDEIKRLVREERIAWLEAYRHFDAMRRGPRSCWAAIMGAGPTYMLQSDFSYMISPDMFAEFVQPELQALADELDHSFYHLDGKNQLGHIPHLAQIRGLGGIQWIPGDGQPPQREWPEVLSDIEDRGMKLQLLGTLDNVEPALRALKHPENVHAWLRVSPDEIERAQRLMADFGF